ncbi:glycosyltransferase [Massilia endophytica]|uniref:glycosyltransferase n=1 Tax=Massilia endophytica TaxID=2899220 RepID=UPI001E54C334|nr:glycosyltransferase [Massilia endophytica]UGQ45484.1 glycosyltransferase [Massilia endophytica]
MSADAQLLLDLSELVRTDARSGIQRVARGVLAALLADPPAGYRVAPVYDAGGFYAYVPDAVALKPAPQGEEEPIAVRAGDVFFGVDLAPEQVPRNLAVLAGLKAHGVRLYFAVYDLLPLQHPEWFFAGAQPWFERWLSSAATVADGLLCNARAIADELLEWLDQHPPRRHGMLQVGYAPLGADLQTARAADDTDAAADLPAELRQRPTLLMVGTLEPRKMHSEVLQACEQLWERGVEVNLAIVGKQGWNTARLAERLQQHPENGRRLFWMQQASDSTLLALYASASALLAASGGEGFGLPLIEAAQHGLPVIARDLPVFREVGGEHAWYFGGVTPGEIADDIETWLALHAEGKAPASAAMSYLSWAGSARRMLDVILGGQWHGAAATRLP